MTTVALGFACAVLLAGCLRGAEDGQCNGYLGCSAGQTIGADAGSSSADVIDGRSASGVNAVEMGPGCGKPLPSDQPATVAGKPIGYKQYTVMGTGASLAGPQPEKVGPRTFWVRVPADYDPNHAYRVVYIGQGCGGYGMANNSTYPLYDEAKGGTEEAIYVALDLPLDMANMACYDERAGSASQEWEAFQIFHTVLDQTYCVDYNRIFAAGYETGAALANMWGCYFAGDGQHPLSDPSTPRAFAPLYHVRGQAGVATIDPLGNDLSCNGPVAALWLSDLDDADDPIGISEGARDQVLARNGCTGSPTAPWHPELTGPTTCVAYTQCPSDYPVVFCTSQGQGAGAQDALAIPAFKLFFDQIN